MKIGLLLRKGVEYSGPLSFAAGSFALSAVIQKVATDPTMFASFALMQTMLGACANFINGFSTIPLTKVTSGQSNEGLYRGYIYIYTILSLALGVVYANISDVYEVGDIYVVVSAAVFVVYSVRWAVKGFSLSEGRRLMPSASDYIYLFCLMLGCGYIYVSKLSDYGLILGIFLAAVFISMGPLLGRYAKVLAGVPFERGRFLRKLKSESGWSTAIVVLTDFGSNSHVYAIYLLLGAKEFAPVALAALLARPIGVCLTSIVQIERRALFDVARRGVPREMIRALLKVVYINAFVMLIYTLALATAFSYVSATVMGRGYDEHEVFVIYVMLSAVLALKIFREPMLAMVQSSIGFKRTTWSGSVFSLIAIAGTFGQLLLVGDRGVYPVVGAVVLSECVYTITVGFLFRNILKRSGCR